MWLLALNYWPTKDLNPKLAWPVSPSLVPLNVCICRGCSAPFYEDLVWSTNRVKFSLTPAFDHGCSLPVVETIPKSMLDLPVASPKSELAQCNFSCYDLGILACKSCSYIINSISDQYIGFAFKFAPFLSNLLKYLNVYQSWSHNATQWDQISC
jgi:hypothetical protein